MRKIPKNKGEKKMRKIWAIFTLFALATVLTTPAFASSVHLKGDHSKPAFTDNGLTLTASGELSGLGFGDVLVNISAVANPTGTCGNPGGNTFQAPGQNPAPVTVTGSVSIPTSELKNGNTPFSVTTNSPTTPIPGAPDCPNSSWTEIITDMSFISAVITVEQPSPTVVLTVTCAFSPATSNGPVPAASVTCTSS
ncbi:hypothetical protein E6H19_08075 [Candidatus Bathyarchaeota archaeon]|nr:MAG: hypothetical protein E6H19_08075 [Candidatus Bathyarchaeota archaeon]